MLADLAALGADGATLAAASTRAAGSAADACAVLPENAEAVALFSAAETQWRCAVAGGLAGGAVLWLGLDYAGLESVLRLTATPRRRWPDLFARLQVLEQAALPVLNERRG